MPEKYSNNHPEISSLESKNNTEELDKPGEIVSKEVIQNKLSRIDFKELYKKLSKDSVFEENFCRPGECLEDIARLIIKLESSLPKFDIFLSDDAGGRILTLLLRKIANQVREKQSKKPVAAYFLTMGRLYDESKIERTKNIDNFLTNKITPNAKVLLITEYIESGNIISQITEILTKLTKNFRIATISIQYFLAHYPNSGKIGDYLDKFYWGNVSGSGLLLHHKEEWAGVIKNEDSSPHPQRYRLKPDLIKKTRQDIEILAKEFMKLLG